MEPRSPTLQVGSEPQEKPIQNYVCIYIIKYMYISQCHRREAQRQKRLYEPYGARLESKVLKY